MRFADDTFVWVAAALTVVLAIAHALDFTRRRRLMARIGHAPQLERMAASASPLRRGLKAFLLVAGLALTTLALARPQIEGESQWRQRGIDIAVVLDFSKSMLAEDVGPKCTERTGPRCGRAQRAKLEVDALIDRFGGDRVSVVAFAGGAIHYPLTSDYEAAKILYHGLTPLDLPPGSDVGEGILTARCILRPDLKRDEDCQRIGGNGEGGAPLDPAEARRERERQLEVTDLGDRARAMVIFTDGEDTDGRAAEQIERAAKLGIEVFVVGVGTVEGAPIPDFDADGRQIGWRRQDDGSHIMTRLDEAGLKALARAGGGEDHYHRVHPKRIGLGLGNLVTALGNLKEGEISSRVVKHYGEAFQFLLYPAFLALLVEACLSDRRRARRRQKKEVVA